MGPNVSQHLLLPSSYDSGTYRYLNIFEQTALMTGEAKHGVWRVHDNGHVREYRKYGKDGLRDNINPNDQGLTKSNLEVIKNHYTSYMPADTTLYKFPEDKVKDGYLQYVDLSIYHPKYGGKYNNHVPIDLAHFFCTMTQAGYPHAYRAWQFATMQPAMNRIGPLGKRAGTKSGNQSHQELF